MRGGSKRFLGAALAGGLLLGAPLAEARADETTPAAPIRPAPRVPVDLPSPRAPLLPYGLGVLGLGSAFVLAGGILLGVAPTHDERCGVAGCYGVLDPKLELAGQLMLVGGIGIGLVGGVVALRGVSVDKSPGPPRRSDHFMEVGILATALGVGLAGVAFTALQHGDDRREGLPGAITSLSIPLALVGISAGMGFWIFGGRDAPKASSASLRVGPTSAHLTFRF